MVLEKHRDFLRDFRGDTIHPSTLELIYELGWLEDLLKIPHQKVERVSAQIGSDTVAIADLSRLGTRCRFVALMPQWDFLNFLVDKARRYPTFRIEMEAQAEGLLERGDRVLGVQATTPSGSLTVRAGLTVGADGRHSVVRARAGLHVLDRGAPMDVLWMRISRQPSDPERTFGHVEPGRMLVMLNRRDYWQCAYLIAKGEADRVRAKGLPAFREELVKLTPYFADRVDQLKTWDDVSVLTVRVDRLEKWSRPGLLCIGDAAHAMSPVGGVGINLAIQDAVAAANLLSAPLRRGAASDRDLARVQGRRNFPTRATQWLQIAIQEQIIRRVLAANEPLRAPWPMKLLGASSWVRSIPARVIGVGFRPEHVATEIGVSGSE